MSYLVINGIDTGAQADSTTIVRDRIGAGITRAQDGTARNNFNARKLHLKTKTKPMTEQSASFLAAMIDGAFDHWPWASDGYSDKGLGPSSATNITYGTGGDVSNGMTLGATTGQVTYPGVVDASGGCSIHVLRFESGQWFSYFISDLGGGYVVYKDGVSQGTTLPSWMAISGSSLQLINTTAAAVQYADLLVISAVGGAAEANAVFDWIDSAGAGVAPALTCTGTFATNNSGFVPMLGTTSDSQVAPAAVSGSLTDAVQLAFELVEV